MDCTIENSLVSLIQSRLENCSGHDSLIRNGAQIRSRDDSDQRSAQLQLRFRSVSLHFFASNLAAAQVISPERFLVKVPISA